MLYTYMVVAVAVECPKMPSFLFPWLKDRHTPVSTEPINTTANKKHSTGVEINISQRPVGPFSS